MNQFNQIGKIKKYTTQQVSQTVWNKGELLQDQGSQTENK